MSEIVKENGISITFDVKDKSRLIELFKSIASAVILKGEKDPKEVKLIKYQVDGSLTISPHVFDSNIDYRYCCNSVTFTVLLRDVGTDEYTDNWLMTVNKNDAIIWGVRYPTIFESDQRGGQVDKEREEVFRILESSATILK